MSLRPALIRALADGDLHSGASLAVRLGVSRSAVWKQVHQLADVGLEVVVEGRRGYRLPRQLELLDRERLLAAAGSSARDACDNLQVAGIIESTNVALAAVAPPPPGCWQGLVAEFQTGGRGRRGRRWHSPYGSGLCLSFGWSFATAPRELPALSLGAAVAVSRALAASGVEGHGLKWPNDIVLGGAKLAGLLVDVDGDARGPLRVIVGIGINFSVSGELAAAVQADGGLAPAGLLDANPALGRNALAGGIFRSLHEVLAGFAESGFAPWAAEWRARDACAGREVTVRHDGEELQGVSRGIGPDGALLLEQSTGVVRVFSGDVSLRVAA
ncbi:MAG: biotin--[acetyl-CoA-carboxylase] ligase [Gammaproteobacteria bacterium]|nr:biotin--[acetyl-CoA-carboxylase] ligase [Gammaproteobacteria bacterium]